MTKRIVGPIVRGAAAALCLAATLSLVSCSDAGDPFVPIPRDPGGPLYYRARVDFDPGPPEVLTCPDEWTDDDGDLCPDDLSEFPAATDTGIDFCADYVGLGSLTAEVGQEGIVTFVATGQDQAGGAVSLTMFDVDTEAIGVHSGPLATPIQLGPCDFTAFYEMDIGCLAECDGNRLTNYEDEQPDPCDPAGLTWGAGDWATIDEITVVEDEQGQPRVLEGSVLAGTFAFTGRNVLPTTPASSAQVEVVTGEYRVLVGSPLWTILGEDMEDCP
jgi:hypothetical protein